VPRKRKMVVPKFDMETPSLANIEYFVWKRQIENAKDNPAELRRIGEQKAAFQTKQYFTMLHYAEQQLLPLLDKYEIAHDDPNRWLLLAYSLAVRSRELTRRPAHAPKKWDPVADAQLCKRVFVAKTQIAKEAGCDIDSVPDVRACERIRDEHPEWYKTKKGRVLDVSTLQKNFREAVRRLLKARKELLPT
jgi:hypothetical protein